METKDTLQQFHEGQVVFVCSQITLLKKIHEGPLSVVFKCQRQDGTLCAVKILKKKGVPSVVVDFMWKEMSLTDLEHPNIVEFYEAAVTKWFMFIVMELADGDVSDLLQETEDHISNQPIIFDIFRQIFDAITFLHGHKIAHRDIKFENMLFKRNADEIRGRADEIRSQANEITSRADEIRIFLCDFGLSAKVNQSENIFPNGTISYLPPELFGPLQSKYNPFAADVWALTITLFKLLTFEEPWSEASRSSEEYSNYLARRDSIFASTNTLRKDLSEQVKRLVLDGLNPDPHLRPNILKFREDFMAITSLWTLKHGRSIEELPHQMRSNCSIQTSPISPSSSTGNPETLAGTKLYFYS
ncbi:kinase-like domain-containing protein [Jimgerdemannia flammicorona]|uniref:Kinase-like domain-containing protein n=1 Tax=Jimgerdemannia flammicorona TaxID=994334 RepID=A0A433D3L1_9FUNG|nr:kinase-like domain-containing protein [Jimgerdemannia flammicorona]